MYITPDRRRAPIGLAGPYHRQRPADYREGNNDDFLRRHEVEAINAAHSSKQTREEFAAKLLQRAGDTRNVILAIEHCVNKGQAAGPNGLRPSDLDDGAKLSMAIELGHLIRDGSFGPGETLTKRIDKGNNRGTRPIKIQNFEDRCVERAVLQVIRPFTDQFYHDCSFGFRSPGRSREEALATAEHHASTLGNWTWISVDIKDAFEAIPTGRLMQMVRKMIPADSICNFIRQITCVDGKKRGIRQGGPLSPELLNIYLHWRLDSWWKKRHPDVPYLRFADDILVLTQFDTAQRLWHSLNDCMNSIGLPIKGTPETTIHDLSSGNETIDWLGFQIRRHSNRLKVTISDKAWWQLEDSLVNAWEKLIPSLEANASIEGWISQMGATYDEGCIESVYRRIRSLASQYGFDEIPDMPSLLRWWHKAFLRDWVRVRREECVRIVRMVRSSGRQSMTPADGSAQQHLNFSNTSGGECSSSTAPTVSEVCLYTDGSCLGASRTGGWAYLVVDQETGRPRSVPDSHPRTTNNRMELQAVLEGLRSIPAPSNVRIFTDSKYVMDGITRWLPLWVDHRWRGKSGSVKNKRLWSRTFTELLRHRVECEHVRAHTGHRENEFVDHLAHTAAEGHMVPPVYTGWPNPNVNP